MADRPFRLAAAQLLAPIRIRLFASAGPPEIPCDVLELDEAGPLPEPGEALDVKAARPLPGPTHFTIGPRRLVVSATVTADWVRPMREHAYGSADRRVRELPIVTPSAATRAPGSPKLPVSVHLVALPLDIPAVDTRPVDDTMAAPPVEEVEALGASEPEAGPVPPRVDDELEGPESEIPFLQEELERLEAELSAEEGGADEEPEPRADEVEPLAAPEPDTGPVRPRVEEEMAGPESEIPFLQEELERLEAELSAEESGAHEEPEPPGDELGPISPAAEPPQPDEVPGAEEPVAGAPSPEADGAAQEGPAVLGIDLPSEEEPEIAEPEAAPTPSESKEQEPRPVGPDAFPEEEPEPSRPEGPAPTLEDGMQAPQPEAPSEEESVPAEPVPSVRALTTNEVITRLQSLDPRHFESLMLETLEHLGFTGIEISRRRPQGGLDAAGWRAAQRGSHRFAIHCRRQADELGMDAARELAVLVTSDPDIDKGMLVSTGDLSARCREFVRLVPELEAIPGRALARRVREFGLELPQAPPPIDA